MPDRLIIKTTQPQKAARDADDGIRFILSTDERDLAGDEVVQTGLTLARDPLPAQIDHGGGMFDLIGEWRSVKFTPHQTTATLKLLARGISRAADLVRDLYESGIQLAASIGFVPDRDAYELIRDPQNDRVTGIRWMRAVLTEASVIVTPANPSAIALAKSLHPTVTHAGPSPTAARDDILRQLGATPQKWTGIPMTIAEQIRAAEVALNALRDKALAATSQLAEMADGEARDALVAEIAANNAAVDKQANTLTVLRTTETQLAARAVSPAPAPAAPAIIQVGPRVTADQKKNLIVRSALVTFEAYLRRVPLAQIIEERYSGDPLLEATKAATLLTQHKAAQNPAMTSVPAWAGALVQDGYGAFLEDLQRESVVPRLPLQQEQFNGYNSITIGARTSSPTTNPNLAAAFRAEGAPIRVGAVGLGSKKLTPKSMGIIGTFTMELFRRSTPNIEQKIHDWMIEDTAVALDLAFLSNQAGTAIQPAGIANALPAGDTGASTGGTAAQITADIKLRLQSMYGQGLGRRPMWIMNPKNLAALGLSLTATGAPAFPSAATSSPTLSNIPVVTSITVPQDVVYLVDCAEIAFAGGTPEFLGTEVATLHEEGDATLVAPIASAGTPNTVAAPARSLYQTFSGALRGIWEVDWLVLRAGAVQTITGVAW